MHTPADNRKEQVSGRVINVRCFLFSASVLAAGSLGFVFGQSTAQQPSWTLVSASATTPTQGGPLPISATSPPATIQRAPTPPLFPTLPVPCRDEFAKVAQAYFARPGGIAVEIGVYRGGFAAKNLRHWRGTYYMIDAWSFRPGDPVGAEANYKNDTIHDQNYNNALRVTAFAGSRRHLIRGLSVPTAETFQDNSIDWAYVDALHTKEAVLADLEAWYPKVRPGGLVTGDDYADKEDTQLCTSQRWVSFVTKLAPSIKNVAANAQWGVISGVNAFTRARNIQLHVTWLPDCYPTPAWYFVKPHD